MMFDIFFSEINVKRFRFNELKSEKSCSHQGEDGFGWNEKLLKFNIIITTDLMLFSDCTMHNICLHQDNLYYLKFFARSASTMWFLNWATINIFHFEVAKCLIEFLVSHTWINNCAVNGISHLSSFQMGLVVKINS